MKEYLVNLIKNWKQTEADEFHSNCLRDDAEGRYIWFYDDTGTTIYRDITAVHIDNTGKCCKLTQVYNNHDWAAFTKLYEIAQDNSFRIEIPLTHSLIENKYLYSEVQRPGYQIGLDFQYDLFENIVDEQYFRSYIDQATVLGQKLKQVVESISGCGYPMVGIPPTKRLRDQEGYFWSDFKKWSINENEFKDRLINDLSVNLFYMENNFGKLSYKDDIKKYAEQKWNLI